MGNSCGGDRNKIKKSFKTQIKLQELFSDVSLYNFEMKIKKYAIDGCISLTHLNEIFSFVNLRTKNDRLVKDIF